VAVTEVLDFSGKCLAEKFGWLMILVRPLLYWLDSWCVLDELLFIGDFVDKPENIDWFYAWIDHYQ